MRYGIRQSSAHSQEAANVIAGTYQATLGCTSTAADLAGLQPYLLNGGTQYGVRQTTSYSVEAANDVAATYQAMLGRADTASELAGRQSYLLSGGTQFGIKQQTSISVEAANDIAATYQAVLGRADTASELTAQQSILLSGGSQSGIRQTVALSQEATADISTTFQGVFGLPIDPASAPSYQNLLVNGGSVLSVTNSMLSSMLAQIDSSVDYEQVLGRDPTSAELASETAEFTQAVAVVSGLTWSSVVTTLDNAMITFFNEINPIGSAIAASQKTMSGQQASNLSLAKSLVLNKNVMAFLNTVSACEFHHSNPSAGPGSYYDRNSGVPQLTDLSKFRKATFFGSQSGKYQLEAGTYNNFAPQLGLTDFSSSTQDNLAAWVMHSRGATDALLAGIFHWRSLMPPTSGHLYR